MKRTIFTTLIVLFSALSLLEAQRLVLVEHFTNTWCPICSSKNPQLYNTIESYSNDVVHIAYHIPVPYSQCILYQANKPDQEARMNYYNIYGSPAAYINGTNGSSGNNLLDPSKLSSAIASAAPLTVNVSKAPASSPDGIGYRVDINIKANSTVDAGNNTRLFVLVAEKSLDYSAPNGETKHPDVFRKFLTSAEGDQISLPQAGNNASMSYSYTIESGWVENNIYPIAFIQNKETKTVYAAGSSLLSSTSGINEFAPADVLNVYPNPAFNELNLSAPLDHPGATARIFSISGKLIQSSGVHHQQIDISGLVPGMYLLRIEDKVGRFVKN
ncbi:MAG: Omp28-related outer membrane protein [Saprospiraceae bacterium]|nr:Omp28-related outer membrane protein [Saprospiraceae bacterium]